MKRVITAIFVLVFTIAASAQVRFSWNVDAETRFDNRECDKQGNLYTGSMTIFGVRATPEIGFTATSGSQENGYGVRGLAHHRFMVGVDVCKDFGKAEKIGGLFRELVLYYSLDKQISPKCNFGLVAGIFPRTKGEGYYSDIFWSDSLKFYDPNHEGILFKFNRPKSYYELGVDWLGHKGPGCRERFIIFSAGQSDITPWMRLGYSAYMYHYASSDEVSGVVDNILANPYICFDAGCWLPLDRLSVTLGYVQAMQRDRLYKHGFVWPQGGEFTFEVRKWNVSLRNRLYFGRDLMPLYNNVDAGGYKYGNELYFGDPYFRVRPDSQAASKPAVYDRVEAFWEPRIAPGLYFKIAALFNFNKGYSGCSQVIAVRFDMNELRKELNDRNSHGRRNRLNHKQQNNIYEN